MPPAWLRVSVIYVFTPSDMVIYGNFQPLLVEETPTCTNIGIFACMGRTNNAPQVS